MNRQTIHDIGEREMLRRVRQWFGTTAPAIELGIGDDAAVLRVRDKIVSTTDTLIENVHFRLHTISTRDLGYKAFAVNLSDLAAMAARPFAAFLALSVPPQTPLAMLHDFFQGLRVAARKFNCPLAGGDLTRAPQWCITLTALGTPAARAFPLRSNAQPGDYIYLTGWPGESGAALFALEHKLHAPRVLLARHQRPTPRLAEASMLARRSPRLAMLDISDGIWCDAHRLAEALSLRIELFSAKLPVSQRLARFAASYSRSPLDFMLFGGEDYELLCASPLPPEKLLVAYEKETNLAPLHFIGRVRAGRGVRLLDKNNAELRLKTRTFEHF